MRHCESIGPVSQAIVRVARLHRMLAGALLRRVGLHPGQEFVMMHLWESGPQRQTDLVALLDSDAATITRMVQRLEHAGFVRRTPSPHDKRVTIVEPSAASLALRAQVEALWGELEAHTVDGLTAVEQDTARQTLGRIEENLKRCS